MSDWGFIFKTAYRDSRNNRGKLMLFMSAIVLGISALVAINSFNFNLVKDIDRQAAKLLGADLMVSGRAPLPDSLLMVIDSLPGEQASQLEMLTMAYLPSVDETQFVSVKGIEGGFPFYGSLNVEPASSLELYKSGAGVLVEEGMLLQYELAIGDRIKLGTKFFTIVGNLKSAFGGNGLASSFAPSVYLALDQLENTGLIGEGSLINYQYFQKLPEEFEAGSWKKIRKQKFKDKNFRLTTVANQKEQLSEAFEALNSFLNLVALIALLLGCIGVASSILIYVKSKISSIAIFRCMGLKAKDAFLIYLVQILIVGLIAVILGAALGSIVQYLIPLVLSDFLPFEVEAQISWRAIIQGITIGGLVTLLFALLPLSAIRHISPLRTINHSVEESKVNHDPYRYALFIAITLAIAGFLFSLTGDIMNAIIFTVALLFAFVMLYFASLLLMWSVRKFFPVSWSYVVRQGLSNLYRPNNQTQSLLVSIGLGTAILTTLFIVQGLILNNVNKMDEGDQPNMVLYGIEASQKDSIAALTNTFGLPLIQQTPIVTMKLEEWKGKPKSHWLEVNKGENRWAMNREARVTYRDHILDTEEIVSGSFTPRIQNMQDSIFISLGDSYAEGLQVELGDELIWNVQGTRIKTYLGSIRKIDFANMNARFFILFPEGVLEEAPQFQLLITKSPDKATTAQYRRAVVKQFPNISVVDLGSILESLNDILSKISYVIKFMAGFSILTGFLVLLSSLMLSKFQRVKESVLLRTLGASRRQVFKIYATEYFLLGSLAALCGIGLSIIASYLITQYQLELDYQLDWFPIFIVFIIVVGTTLAMGLLNSREVLNKSPLEVLRSESS